MNCIQTCTCNPRYKEDWQTCKFWYWPHPYLKNLKFQAYNKWQKSWHALLLFVFFYNFHLSPHPPPHLLKFPPLQCCLVLVLVLSEWWPPGNVVVAVVFFFSFFFFGGGGGGRGLSRNLLVENFKIFISLLCWVGGCRPPTKENEMNKRAWPPNEIIDAS